MDADYDRYPPGSPEHYAAYKTNFLATDGAGAPRPDDPAASYEIEYACELAHLAVAEAMYGQGERQNAISRRGREPLGLVAGNLDEHGTGNHMPEAG
jgi:hypothetical protein